MKVIPIPANLITTSANLTPTPSKPDTHPSPPEGRELDMILLLNY